MEGKGQKRDRNGDPARTLSVAHSAHAQMPTFNGPSTTKAVLGVETAKEGPFQFLATVWPCAVEADA